MKAALINSSEKSVKIIDYKPKKHDITLLQSLIGCDAFGGVGYTYDRENYGQYEATSGSRQWSSQQRDPRTLIDQSIREIAKTMAIGRFFTRRV